MSTEAWYEIYVVDEESSTMELAIHFFRRGGGQPEEAVQELRRLDDCLDALARTVPTHFVDDLLHDNRIDGGDVLPRSFSIGCYFFLLFRGLYDAGSYRSQWEWGRIPENERPDVQLRQRVRQAIAKCGGAAPDHENPVINRAHSFLNVGRFVETWAKSNRRYTFMEWLQRITKVNDEYEPGFRAGEYEMYDDLSYVHRLFVFVPRLCTPQSVSRVCFQISSGYDESDFEPSGIDPDLDPELEADFIAAEERFLARFEALGDRRVRLQDLVKRYRLVPVPLWSGGVSRRDYLGP